METQTVLLGCAILGACFISSSAAKTTTTERVIVKTTSTELSTSVTTPRSVTPSTTSTAYDDELVEIDELFNATDAPKRRVRNLRKHKRYLANHLLHKK